MLDVGITEEHAVTLAAGLAAGGMKPYFCYAEGHRHAKHSHSYQYKSELYHHLRDYINDNYGE